MSLDFSCDMNEPDNELTVLQWPPQSPELSPVGQLWDVVEILITDEQLTNLQQLRDAVMSIWTNSGMFPVPC